MTQDSDARTELDYGHWVPALEAGRVFSRSESVSFLRPAEDGGIWFLLSKPDEGNIQALMHQDHKGVTSRVSPAGMNLRSAVHEYGGLPYAAMDDQLVYCQFSDQRLYKQSFDVATGNSGEALPLTPAGPFAKSLRYLEPVADPARKRLIAVREDHRDPDRVINALVSIDLETGGEGDILFSDSDFVSSPRLSPDGRSLVFLSWNHPDMPWDHTRLHIADVADDGTLHRLRSLQGQNEAALVQPVFAGNGDLLLMSDRSNWWNPWRIRAAALKEDSPAAEQVLALDAECCSPPWQAGYRQMAVIDERRLLLSVNRQGFHDLVIANLDSGELQPLLQAQGQIESVFWHQERALAIVAETRDTTAIMSIDPGADGVPQIRYRCHSEARPGSTAVAVGEPFSYATGSYEQAYGVFYAPCNPACEAPEGSLPPLIVMVHGGPTGCARTGYNPATQYWTSRGFAVFDVNHRGSTGFGRRFRRALYGQWGVVDVEDVINGIQALVERGSVDPQRVVIRGGSAGGYAVLSALVHSELFSAGASYYGVSDLSLLAADTHKFESRYLDQLIGPWPEAEAVYRDRSPLHHIEKINAPVLLLQGSEDKVVPPNQADAIFDRLKQRNPASDYILFEGEGHGFRKPENQIRALESELAFYRSVLQ